MDVRLSPEQQALRDSVVQVCDRLAPGTVRDLGDVERQAKLDAAVEASGWRELRVAEDDGAPLPQQLVDAALRIARRVWEQEHRVVTRDQLRKALEQRGSGWTGGMAHTTFSRLAPIIRRDLGLASGKPAE